MLQNFEINSKAIDKIKRISPEEKNFRIENLKLFKTKQFKAIKFLISSGIICCPFMLDIVYVQVLKM